MADLTPPKFSLKNISRWPLAFLAVILLWIAREFMFRNFEKDDERNEALTKTVDYYMAKDKVKDSTIAYWQLKYAGELEKNANYFKQKDSVNRAALEKPAKDLLQSVNKTKDD